MQHRSRHPQARHPHCAIKAVAAAHPASCLSPLAWLSLVALFTALLTLSLLNTARAGASCPLGLTDTSKGAHMSLTTEAPAPLDLSFQSTPLDEATFALG